MRKIRQGRAPRLPTVSTTLQMIDRKDVCRGILLALDQASPQVPAYVLHDGQTYGINMLEQEIHRASQMKLPAFALPGFCWWLGAKAGDTLFALTGKSLGFSSHSWRTLFCQEASATNSLPGFIAVHRFEERLPAILKALHSA
jgi:hypothetical protein